MARMRSVMLGLSSRVLFSSSRPASFARSPWRSRMRSAYVISSPFGPRSSHWKVKEHTISISSVRKLSISHERRAHPRLGLSERLGMNTGLGQTPPMSATMMGNHRWSTTSAIGSHTDQNLMIDNYEVRALPARKSSVRSGFPVNFPSRQLRRDFHDVVERVRNGGYRCEQPAGFSDCSFMRFLFSDFHPQANCSGWSRPIMVCEPDYGSLVLNDQHHSESLHGLSIGRSPLRTLNQPSKSPPSTALRKIQACYQAEIRKWHHYPLLSEFGECIGDLLHALVKPILFSHPKQV